MKQTHYLSGKRICSTKQLDGLHVISHRMKFVGTQTEFFLPLVRKIHE